MKLTYAQQLAMTTWYAPDDPEAPGKQDQILHACMGLAGEAGEMIDLLKKQMFAKPGFVYRPEKAVDELSDFWYYLRVAAALTGIPLSSDHVKYHGELTELKCLSLMASTSIYILLDPPPFDDEMSLLHKRACGRADQLGWTLPEITMLNWLKLREGNHGWKDNSPPLSPRAAFDGLKLYPSTWPKILEAHMKLGRMSIGDGIMPPD